VQQETRPYVNGFSIWLLGSEQPNVANEKRRLGLFSSGTVFHELHISILL
jgi:hypothetical protein